MGGNVSLISYTYARALKNSFSKDQEEIFFIASMELNQLNETFNDPEVKAFFLSPVVLIEEKKQVLRKIFNSFKLNSLLCPFLFLLLDKKRWKELDSIVSCLRKMMNEMKGLVSVEVEAIETLSPVVKEELIEKLENFFNKKVSLKEKISSKELIGGLKIRAGGFIFDDTLFFHLRQLENQIRRNFYDYTS